MKVALTLDSIPGKTKKKKKKKNGTVSPSVPKDAETKGTALNVLGRRLPRIFLLHVHSRTSELCWETAVWLTFKRDAAILQ